MKSEYFSDSEIVGFLSGGVEDDNQTIKDFLNSLLSLYEISQDGKPLSYALIKDWPIFVDEKSLSIVLDMLGSRFQPNDPVRYIAEYRDYLQAWDDVKAEMKTNTRFFCQMDSIVDILNDFNVDSDSLILFKNEQFFRARVHHKEEPTFSIDEMGCPPKPALATPGRANPNGIRYLYLCCDNLTPFYEVRPYYLDRVDVGEFLIQEDNLKIVDFTEKVNLFNVFYDEGENVFKQKVKRRVLFDAISNDLSKPIRSFDSELEYVPTQYICEFFKCRGADGVKFKSSVRDAGKNLVLFYPNKAKCVNVYPYEVSKITIDQIQL